MDSMDQHVIEAVPFFSFFTIEAVPFFTIFHYFSFFHHFSYVLPEGLHRLHTQRA